MKNTSLAQVILGAVSVVALAAGCPTFDPGSRGNDDAIASDDGAGGGDSLDTGSSASSLASQCVPADPNALLFQKAICVCEQVREFASVTTGGFSSFGNLRDSEHRGDVGINQGLDTVGQFLIDGALEVGGLIRGMGPLVTTGDLWAGSDWQHAGHASIGGNAQIGGDLSVLGQMTVAGSLAVAGDVSLLGHLYCGNVTEGAAVAPRSPCDCDPATLLDVAATVAANANATPLALARGWGQQVLMLTAGAYYDSDGTTWLGHSKIVIDGAVQIYIDGDVNLAGASKFELTDGAQLDLYIAGAVREMGWLGVGDMTTASHAVRIYIGGSEPVAVSLMGRSRFAGAIYAPQADIRFVGDLRIDGALFARN
ncbi:MAG: hypothetical protein JXR83_18800, partial [Deltaproteobacteria bacterium]|nr:hypothetical protein [Deltaproteobacteria bacterium]